MDRARKRYEIIGGIVMGFGVMLAGAAETDDPWAEIDSAVAAISPTAAGGAEGQVRFESNEDGSVTVTAHLQGLEPGGEHGFHVHQYGDCTGEEADGAGDHYNPEDHPHGLPEHSRQRHAGDLGNLRADQQGRARRTETVDTLTVSGDRNPVLGRSVIVHRGPDDGSQPSGDAGPAIGCGVIGVAPR